MGIWTIGICAMRRRVWSYDVMPRASEGCANEKTFAEDWARRKCMSAMEH